MFQKIKSFLSRESHGDIQVRDLNSYFLSELHSYPDIPESKYNVVLSHLNHEQKLDNSKIEKLFGVENSKAVDVLNSLKSIYYRASCEKAWDDSFIKALQVNSVKSFILKNTGTNEHCDFCLSKFDQEMPLTIKTLKLFHANCKCKPYKKSFIEPVIKF